MTPGQQLADMEKRRRELNDRLDGGIAADQARGIQRQIDQLNVSIQRLRVSIYGKQK